MIYKRCIRCGKRIEAGRTCECFTKYIKQPKGYKKPIGARQVYHTKRWEKLRNYIMSKYDGIDLYAWYAHKTIVPANTVHHIIPVVDDETHAYDADNLIPVSDASHKEIHSGYKVDKKEMQKILREAIAEWRRKTGGS